MDWREYIVCDPKVLGGKPTIKGTRLSVDFVVELLNRSSQERKCCNGRKGGKIVRRQVGSEDVTAGVPRPCRPCANVWCRDGAAMPRGYHAPFPALSMRGTAHRAVAHGGALDLAAAFASGCTYIAAGWRDEMLRRNYPTLTDERVRAVLTYAAQTFRDERFYLLPPLEVPA